MRFVGRGPVASVLATTIAVIAVIAVAACSGVAPRGVPLEGPATAAAEPTLSGEEADAREFRVAMGLRSDLAWIRKVAQDPSSADGKLRYDVPLMPDETADLDSRPKRTEDIVEVIEGYGSAHPDEWAGLWIDQSRGASVVAQFTGHIDEHREGIRRQLRPDALFEVRRVRWPLHILRALKDRITTALMGDDGAWYRTIDAFYASGGVDIRANVVSVEISSSNPDAARLVQEHFGATDGRLRVESDGTGTMLHLPAKGTLIVIARDAAGRPIAGLDCVLEIVAGGRVPYGALPAATDKAGRCRIETWAVEYDVRLQDELIRVVGRGHVVVPPRAQVVLPITVKRP